jgi:hypothetical protein
MAAVKDMKKLGPAFSNDEVVIRAVYDFAKDGGAVGALDLFEAGADILITHFSSVVKTAVTSTGNLTLAVGVTGATTAFMTATQGAKANLVADAAIFPLHTSGADDTSWVPTLPRKLSAGDKVLQTIGTEVANAGKVEYCIKYVRA